MDQRHHRISIHAPRMGSDLEKLLRGCFQVSHFNPRSPDGERRFDKEANFWAMLISIHAPRMGSDRSLSRSSYRTLHFNPRSPDGERRSLLSLVLSEMRFQSTLPGWGATFNVIGDVGAGVFQSTLPGWGATQQRRHPVQQGRISIHAPRVGSDPPPCRSCCPGRYFNPRSPGGERPRKWTSSPTIWAKSSIFNTDCIADRH